METQEKKQQCAEDRLQVSISLPSRRRFKAGAESPTSVNITIGDKNDQDPDGSDQVSLSIDLSV